MDPALDNIRAAHKVGAHAIEINTNAYATARTEADREHALRAVEEAAKLGHKLGLGVLAGHALNYRNVGPVAGHQAHRGAQHRPRHRGPGRLRRPGAGRGRDEGADPVSTLPEGLQAAPTMLSTGGRVLLALWALSLLMASRRLPRFTVGQPLPAHRARRGLAPLLPRQLSPGARGRLRPLRPDHARARVRAPAGHGGGVFVALPVRLRFAPLLHRGLQFQPPARPRALRCGHPLRCTPPGVQPLRPGPGPGRPALRRGVPGGARLLVDASGGARRLRLAGAPASCPGPAPRDLLGAASSVPSARSASDGPAPWLGQAAPSCSSCSASPCSPPRPTLPTRRTPGGSRPSANPAGWTAPASSSRRRTPTTSSESLCPWPSWARGARS